MMVRCVRRMDADTERDPERALRILSEVLAPLIAADGGKLYLLEISADRVALHLSGRYAGCPGNTLATRRVIEPVVRAAWPGAEVRVTAGTTVPSGARLLPAEG